MAWMQRLRNVFADRRMQREIDREVSFHIAERTDELRANGLPAEEAQYQARRQFGNVTGLQEETREMDIATWVEAAFRNFRYAARGLWKTPGFTITVLLTLALGIGANSAVFSAIHAVLLRPLPFPEGDQLMEVRQLNAKSAETPVAPVRLGEWQRSNKSFQAIAGYYVENNSELSGDLPERVKRAWVTPQFLQVWGVSAAIGRDFSPPELRYGGPNAVLISDRFWRRRFGASPDVLTKAVRIGNLSFSIVGVMPASFLFPVRDVDLWSPSPMDAPYAQSRENTWFNTIGRLKQGVTAAQANADMASIQGELGRQFPKTDANIRVDVRPLKDTTVGGFRRSLWVLFGSVTLLLLIACTNIAALLLSRAAQRQQEISIRFSLGASRAAVASQLLTEVLILSVGGAVLGLLAATGAAGLLRSLAKSVPRVEEINLDWRVVTYSLVCALGATLLCGLLPSIQGTRRGLSGALAQTGRSQVSGRQRTQLWLVGVQVALSVTLLAGAGLLLRSLQALSRVSPGFDSSRIFTAQISSSWGETGDMKGVLQRTERVLDTLRSIPGVESAATSMSLPGVMSQYQNEVQVAGQSDESQPKIMAESRAISPDYFGAMRIPMLSGELCSSHPDRPSVVVNRTFANLLPNGGANVVGRQLSRPGTSYRMATISGIAADARESGIDRVPPPTVYWCFSAMQPTTYFLIRTKTDFTTFGETLRRKIHEVEPQRSVFNAKPLDEHISEAYAQNRLRTFLLAFFAFTAVSLSCLGLYGTLSYLVNLRRREVGLRLALGAERGNIVTHFLRQGLIVSISGCVVGLGLSIAFTQLLAGMLFGVSPTDPTTLLGVVGVVMVTAVVASLVPAVRASRFHPMQVLREQ